MRVLLDAYFDNNFGDDLFIDILLKRYSDATFYTFWKDTPDSVLARAVKFSNLVILPGGCSMQETWRFDAFVMIGGDVLPDGVDYTERINRMRRVKEGGGLVVMLGFSLYKEYGEKTIADLHEMADLADAIVIRDNISAQRFKDLVPSACVTESTDMVFAALKRKEYRKDNVLGVIPRRKLYSTEEEHWAYCQSMATIADSYVQNCENGGVRFLAFSTGEYDDRITSKDIISLMKMREKAELVAYEGDIDSFLQAIGSCKVLLPTRFHGLVFALLYRIPFVPIPYEVKVAQLLDEIKYDGIRLAYGEKLKPGELTRTMLGMKQFGVLEGVLEEYELKSKCFFEVMDTWKETYQRAEDAVLLGEKVCSVNAERRQLFEENQMLRLQQVELEKWIDILKQQGKDLEDQNIELESIRQKQVSELQVQNQELEQLSQKQVQQLSQILVLESDKRMLEKQVDELIKWIDNLKEERQKFEQQNFELESHRKWLLEKIRCITCSSNEFEAEYNLFVSELQKKCFLQK